MRILYLTFWAIFTIAVFSAHEASAKKKNKREVKQTCEITAHYVNHREGFGGGGTDSVCYERLGMWQCTISQSPTSQTWGGDCTNKCNTFGLHSLHQKGSLTLEQCAAKAREQKGIVDRFGNNDYSSENWIKAKHCEGKVCQDIY